MSKINLISNHISECDKLINSTNLEEIKDYIYNMVAVYQAEIDKFSDNLSTLYIDTTLKDAIKDLKTIKMMLENYRENIEGGFIKTDNNSGINISNVANATATTNVNISFNQIIDKLNDLPEEILSNEDKEELEDKLRALESAANSGNKDKIKSKLERLFNFSLEKGPVVISLVSSAVSFFTEKILPLFLKY